MSSVTPPRTLLLTERVPRLCRLRPADVAFLLTAHRNHLDLTSTGRRQQYQLTPGGYVGVIVAPSCRLVIRPKISLANLFFLLNDAAPPTDVDTVAPRAGRDVLDFLAARLAWLMRERARVGLHRAYVEQTEQGPFLHGRLDLPAQLRQPPGRKDQLHGRHDDLSADVVCNQLPKATAEYLLSLPLLGEAMRTRLCQALRGFAGIQVVSSALDLRATLVPEHWPAAYRPLLDLCGLLLGSLTPSILAGETLAPAFLLNMEHIFERYLTRGFVAAFADRPGYRVAVQKTYVVNKPTNGPDVTMRPDLILEDDSGPVLVVDAKWKRLPRDTAAVTADLYQVLAYGVALGAARVVLVYPGRRHRVRDYQLIPTPLRVAIHTLRVIGTPEACRRSLRRLMRSLPIPASRS